LDPIFYLFSDKKTYHNSLWVKKKKWGET